MLCLLGVLLSCGALCLTSPVPRAAGTGCADSTLILETLSEVEMLKSKERSKLDALNNLMEEGGNITTYLEVFIQALKSDAVRQPLIAQKLQKIKDNRTSCQWTEEDWEPVEEKDFLGNLEYLLRFLNHYSP